jgi:hypothetical protein
LSCREEQNIFSLKQKEQNSSFHISVLYVLRMSMKNNVSHFFSVSKVFLISSLSVNDMRVSLLHLIKFTC